MKPTLLDVIDDLTLPKNERLVQDVLEPVLDPETKQPLIDWDGIPRTVKVGTVRIPVTADPLLLQLRDAVTASLGGLEGSRGRAHEQIPLDPDALDLYIHVTSTIVHWCIAHDLRVTWNPLKDLRSWYAATRADNRFAEAVYLEIVSGWARRVHAMFDRWDEQVLLDPCPRCGATEWRAPNDPLEYQGRPLPGRRYPLLLRFHRSDGENMIERARVHCRACDPEARRAWGPREFRYEVEHRMAEA